MAIQAGKVRQNTYESYPEGTERELRVNRRGELVVIDFWTQLVIDGRMFHMQVGTEDAPTATCGTLDDTLAHMLVDGKVGTTYIPAYADAQLATYAATTVPPMAMLEIDRAKARYSSGGSAFVPENLRTDRPRTSNAAAAYVGEDITALAKTAVPGSMEIARRCFGETAPTATNEPTDFLHNLTPLFVASQRPGAVVVGVGSILLHFGCATADGTGYSVLQWAEIDTDNVT